MKKIIFALLLLCSPALAQTNPSAKGTIKKDFVIKNTPEKTIQWMEDKKNQKLMHEAMGIQIIKDLGNGKLQVKKETAKGTFIWTMQEKIENKNGKYKYTNTLVDSLNTSFGPKMSFSNTELTVTPAKKNQSTILIKVEAGVIDKNEDISDFDIRFDINLHTSKLKKLLESKLE